jgi:outer membrane protein assembly factor BamB
LYDNLLIVNASVESSALVALDKRTGEEVWRAKGIGSSWNTPIVVGEAEDAQLVVSVRKEVFGFDPRSGEKLWYAEGVDRYVCPSVVAHDGVAYVIGGGHTSLAVRTGGRGNVTDSHVVWRKSTGANVPSPIYVDGHLYWPDDGAGTLVCQDASTGEIVSQQRLSPRPGRIWASPVLADGRLYLVSQYAGTYVVAAKPEFELLAHNVIEGDESRTNASPAVSDGQLFLRSDANLYCIGAK